MARKNYKNSIRLIIPLFLIIGMVGCTSSKSNYQREYTRLWKELIKSEAWKNSLATSVGKDTDGNEFYASSGESGIAGEPLSSTVDLEVLFNERFNALTARAYVKIIAEAEDADKRLKAEYDRWNAMQQNPNLKKDKAFKKNFETVNKKYAAHKQMLEGLRSWNIFSEFRSNDLDFFRAENRDEIRNMYQNGSTESVMVNYLVYRLADLYHYEE